MNTIELAPGLNISRVVTGLWQIADLERNGTLLDPNTASDAMAAYADAGLTTFDMADHYGSAEIISGKLKNKYQSRDIQLFTKWVPKPGPLSKQDVQDAVQRSLDRMQVAQLDLLQYHAWNYADPRWLDGLLWLGELKENGLIRHIGLTNFDTNHLRVALGSGVPIASNQICYSLLDQRAADAMTRLCLERNVKLLAFGTLAGGFLSDKWVDRPEPAINDGMTWSQMKYKRFIDATGGWKKFQTVLKVLQSVAAEHKTSISTVATGYILDQPAVAGVIIGARLTQSEHIGESARVPDLQLNSRNLENIKEVIGQLDPVPGDCGDEYRKPPFLTASGDLSHHIETFPPPYPVTSGQHGSFKALSGTVWEDLAGFSRAIRKGNRILVSGTTATHGSIAIGSGDPSTQTHYIIDKIEGAIQSLGGSLSQVVRTRIFIRNISDWEVIARVHGERFRDIQPANTMVRADLIGEEYLVEMEAEAVLS